MQGSFGLQASLCLDIRPRITISGRLIQFLLLSSLYLWSKEHWMQPTIFHMLIANS